MNIERSQQDLPQVSGTGTPVGASGQAAYVKPTLVTMQGQETSKQYYNYNDTAVSYGPS